MVEVAAANAVCKGRVMELAALLRIFDVVVTDEAAVDFLHSDLLGFT